MKLTTYGVYVAGIFDLRYLAEKCDSRDSHPGNIAMLSIEHLNVKLGEDFRLDEMRWKRNRRIAEVDINYAAKSVRVAIELFKKFEEKLSPGANDVHTFIDEHCSAYRNKLYRYQKSAQKQTEAANGSQERELALKPEIHMIQTVQECQAVVCQIREYVIIQILRSK